MIDYTNIQLNRISQAGIPSQKINNSLKTENNGFRDILIAIAVGGVIFIGFAIYKSIQQEKDKLDQNGIKSDL